MQVDLSVPVYEVDGSVAGNDAGPLTLGSLALQALISPLKDDPVLPPAEAERRYRLALVLREKGPADLSVEDCSLLRERACALFSVWAAGQLCLALGGTDG